MVENNKENKNEVMSPSMRELQRQKERALRIQISSSKTNDAKSSKKRVAASRSSLPPPSTTPAPKRRRIPSIHEEKKSSSSSVSPPVNANSPLGGPSMSKYPTSVKSSPPKLSAELAINAKSVSIDAAPVKAKAKVADNKKRATRAKTPSSAITSPPKLISEPSLKVESKLDKTPAKEKTTRSIKSVVPAPSISPVDDDKKLSIKSKESTSSITPVDDEKRRSRKSLSAKSSTPRSKKDDKKETKRPIPNFPVRMKIEDPVEIRFVVVDEVAMTKISHKRVKDKSCLVPDCSFKTWQPDVFYTHFWLCAKTYGDQLISTCSECGKRFLSSRGIIQHLAYVCKKADYTVLRVTEEDDQPLKSSQKY